MAISVSIIVRCVCGEELVGYPCDDELRIYPCKACKDEAVEATEDESYERGLEDGREEGADND